MKIERPLIPTPTPFPESDIMFLNRMESLAQTLQPNEKVELCRLTNIARTHLEENYRLRKKLDAKPEGDIVFLAEHEGEKLGWWNGALLERKDIKFTHQGLIVDIKAL